MNEKIAQWHLLFFHYLKRDWKKLISWILGIGLFSGGLVSMFEEVSQGQGLVGMYETMQNPAMIFMVGMTPIETSAQYTVGAMYAQEMLLICGLFAMIVSSLHVVNHTRKEEELGLTELIRSFQVGRQANSLAVITEVILANLVLGVFIGSLMISFGEPSIDVTGAFLFGAAIGLAGIIGGVFALVVAQIMPTATATTGTTLGMIGLLYLLRAGTDITRESLSMINPVGWIYLTFPFTTNNWLPILFGLIFSFLLLGIGFVLEEHRDMGTGYLPERNGRKNARKSLLSVSGLFLHLNRGVMIGWFVFILLMGVAYGSIYGDMQVFLNSNELMQQMFIQTGGTIEASFTSVIMMVMSALVTILPIAVVNKLFAEESHSYLSQFFSTRVTRGKLYGTSITLAILTGIGGILIAALSLGGTAIQVMDEQAPITLQDFILAGFNYFPTILFFIGLAAVALGWLPKFNKLIYVYLGYCFALTYFGRVLNLPNWVEKTAIQSWFPQMPMENFDGVVFIVVMIISICLLLVGFIGYNKRDMIESA